MNQNNRKRILVVEVVCVLFILLFAYASVTKMLDFEQFRTELRRSPLLTFFATWVAIGIPMLEVILSIFLTIERFRLASIYCAYGLMVIFSAYIVAITKFADYIPCSCGGVLSSMNWKQHLVFNCAFIAFALIAIFIYPSKESLTFENTP
ncbi:MauE/DoxX family redox-associated membrane protein [Pedobacter heparinus]|uniref:MauE/DoxX family redox-associated membrane protein n=1 Tax=Pedobacter heparinus TaxID=984 RepID=UPI0039773E89